MEDNLEQFNSKLRSYSKEELIDISRNIDKDKYPDRYNLVIGRLNELNDISTSVETMQIRYGGFWKRFLANFIDSLICFVILLPLLFLVVINKYFILLMPAFGLFLVPTYSIYFNYKKGATPGKQFAGLKILTVDFNNISLKEACLRSSGDIVFGGLQIIGMLLGVKAILTGIESHSGVINVLNSITESSTSLYKAGNTLENLWFWSEVIVLLFNKKRRAIHDYIANTVVVEEESLSIQILSNIS